ncbi:hypothetical protein EB093_09640, partial [bacterium]|nr:hypothetical protein [bacterium]
TVLLSAFVAIIAGLAGAGIYYVTHHGTFIDEVKHQAEQSISGKLEKSNPRLFVAITEFIDSGTTVELRGWFETKNVPLDTAIKITKSIKHTANDVLKKKIRSWSVTGAPTEAEGRAARALTMCLLVAATGGNIDLSDNPATRPVPTAGNRDLEAQNQEEKSNAFAVVIDASTRVTTRLWSHGTRIENAIQEAKTWAPPQRDTAAVSSPGRHLVSEPSHSASPSLLEETLGVLESKSDDSGTNNTVLRGFASPSSIARDRIQTRIYLRRVGKFSPKILPPSTPAPSESKSDDEVSIDDVRLSLNASSPLVGIPRGRTVEQAESDSDDHSLDDHSLFEVRPTSRRSLTEILGTDRVAEYSLDRFPTSPIYPRQTLEMPSDFRPDWTRVELNGSTFYVDPTLAQHARNFIRQAQRGQSGWPREAFQSVGT